MDDVNSIWQIGIIALVAGAMIGALAYRLLAPSVKQADKVKSELEQAQDELSSYKASVSSHFNKTSELVNDLTQNYVKVYQHLADGAQTLGDSKTLNNLLEQHQGRVLLTVDDESGASESNTDAARAGQAPVDVVKEKVETVVVTDTAEPEPAKTDDVTAESLDTQPAADNKDEVAGAEPVLDVSKIEQVAEQIESGASKAADSNASESKDGAEVRPVTH